MLDRDGVALRDQGGKIRYSPIVSFMNHGTRASWSRQIIAAIPEAPKVLAEVEEAI